MDPRPEPPGLARRYRRAAAGLAAVGIAAAAYGFLRPSPPGSLSGGSGEAAGRAAPELAGITGWINTPPLTLASLRGQVVLVDFWTLSCINCRRTWPALRAWYRRYHAGGLEYVYVHAPEFDFEREVALVRRVATEHELDWPIAVDEDFATWRAFGNHFWPRVYLIDRSGRIRYDHVGEGAYDRTEAQIRALLAEGGATPPPALPAAEPPQDSGLTAERYLGYGRGVLGNAVEARRDTPAPMAAPAAPEEDVPYLAGRWTWRAEGAELAAEEGEVVLSFRARDVFVVVTPGAPGARLVASVDGGPGEAMDAARPDLYHVVALPASGRHVLRLRVAGPGTVLYAFTFGG